MAGGFADFTKNWILEYALGETDFDTLPVTYMALCTAAPVDTDDGSSMDEATGTNYARVATLNKWGTAATGVIANDVAITFAEAGAGGWGVITHFAIMDGDTEDDDEIVMWGPLTASKLVSDGDTVEFAVGDIDLTLD